MKYTSQKTTHLLYLRNSKYLLLRLKPGRLYASNSRFTPSKLNEIIRTSNKFIRFSILVVGKDWFVDQFDKILFDDLLLDNSGSKNVSNLQDFDTSNMINSPQSSATNKNSNSVS